MKKISIFITIALMAIIYSCGNGENGSTEQNTDSLATETAEQVDDEEVQNEQTQNQNQPSNPKQTKGGLYKYFSKEEISENMQFALKTLDSAHIDRNSELDDTDIQIYYISLLKHEGLWDMSPEKAKEIWGNPIQQRKVKNEYHNDSFIIFYYYPHFTVSFMIYGNQWTVRNLVTDTQGFGFCGVFVGIPECNKAYIQKLLAKGETRLYKDKESEFEKWSIDMGNLDSGCLEITFSPSGIVKQVSYELRVFEG